MGTVYQVLGVHSILLAEIWLLSISIKKRKKLLTHFTQAINRHRYSKKIGKNIHIHSKTHFTTGREIDKEVVDDLFPVEEVGNKHFEYFPDKFVMNKKSLFELFYKASLITGNEKKSFYKTFISRKGGLSNFWFTVNKVVKFTEAFKLTIISVPLAAAILNPTLYQPDKAGLRSYIINLPRISSHEYRRDVK